MQYVMVVDIENNDDSDDDTFDWDIDAACSYVARAVHSWVDSGADDIDVTVSVRPLSEIIAC